ncbi:fermentation associated [Trichoderma cornu-damae]|uniref:Fermentation associated n=1 Tax=Trichoderma cornu-damae TaxID=654480 RepID=A0A9P8QMA2_9HYPO|nr:fermentation associated [Trichoderma cornu-damae]
MAANHLRPSEFLIFIIVSAILAIFFLLYFNRLFGSIVSYGVRTWTWHRYRIYLDIQALQISLLAGRVFFTGLRYHGSNETFCVQHGDITWRYWLRRVREADIFASDAKGGSPGPERDRRAALPCRINVNLVGLEWFVYNRSPAYDSILAGIIDSNSSGSSSSSGAFHDKGDSGLRSRNTNQGDFSERDPMPHEKSRRELDGNGRSELGSRPSLGSGSRSSHESDDGENAELPFILKLLPIRIECQKAAAVFGNDNTKAILIVKADSLSGDVDASETETVDQYRQIFKIELEHPVVEMLDNQDYKEDQAARAKRERESVPQEPRQTPRKSYFRQRRRKALSSLRNLVPYWRRSVESFSSDSRAGGGAASAHVPGAIQWQGLSRYLDDQDIDDKTRWSPVEYAAVSTILDSPACQLTVYWDAVSKVTEDAHRQRQMDPALNINGSEPPAWGVQLSVKGGTMNYGPWADRQRADLQRVFAPSLSKDGSAASPLPVGAWRMPTQFDLLIELEDTVTLRIPIREESKNWRWRGKEPLMKQETARNSRKQRNRAKKNSKSEAVQLRPAGWLEFKLPPNSAIRYFMDMVASSAGYKNRLTVHLPSTELWSSVNHDLLWRSGPQQISCDLSNPLSWNALRSWHFNLTCDGMDMYLLRDHIFLIVDLVDDWAAGPPAEYLVFTPFLYHLHISLRNVNIYLNVNDENIIDKATAMDDNTYIILSSPELKAETCIPLDKFRPSRNSIPFDIRADALDLALHASQSNTQATFLKSRELGHIEGLGVIGSYQYNATTSPANTDTLVLNVHAQSPGIYLYGFLVRYFMLLKDNYFGEHVHFRTQDEYQEQLQAKKQNPDAERTVRPPSKKSNDLDVMLAIKLDDPRLLIPSNIYSAKRYVQGELASLSLDLRFTNYYMDMELDLSPLSLSLGSSDSNLDSPSVSSSNTQLFVDGVQVFGHRTFGLPPSEPTYLCNWDVSVGAVTGECTTDFLAALAKAGPAFGFTFDDVENALVPYSSLIFYDITFVRVAVQSVRLWIHVEESVFCLSTDAIDVNSNDWARSHYSKRANILIPNVQLSCVNADSAARHKSRPQYPVETQAYLKTDIRLATIGRKFHFSEERQVQQDLIHREDQRTDRTPFLLLRGAGGDLIPEQVDPPAQCMPPPPPPLAEAEDDKASAPSTVSSRPRRVARQKSFLSFAGSSSGSSIRLPNSRRGMRRPSRFGDNLSMRSAAMRGSRSEFDRADISASPGRRSSFYSTVGDFSAQENTEQSQIAFSSQYFTPNFPLDGVRPDSRDATFPPIEDEDFDFFDRLKLDLNDIDPVDLSENHAQSSTIIEFPSGIGAFVTPEAIRHATILLGALQPTEPEDVLDSLQCNTITEIFKSRKEAQIRGEMSDLMVRLPRVNVRFLNSSMLDSPDPSEEELDQYDLTVSKISVVTRTTKEHGVANPRTSLDLRLGSVEMSASERLSSVQKPQAAVMLQVDGVRVSLGAKEITYFDADIGSVVGSTASGKIEYLASLIHRTGNVAAELQRLLTEVNERHSACVGYFVYRLLQVGEATNDPSFLIRPSAVLRSANQHLRTVDSWKMIMRLRQIWETKNEPEKARLIQECWSQSPALPPDVVQRVVLSFEKWRNWDLGNVSRTLLLKKVFGHVRTDDRGDEQVYPLLGACKLGKICLVLDPGPKQNKVGLEDLSVRLERKLADPATTVLGAIPVTVLNLCCGDASVNLNWELCVLADDILRLYNRNQGQAHLPRPPPPPPAAAAAAAAAAAGIQKPVLPAAKPPQKPSSAYHFALELIKGSIEIETVNLSAKTLGDGLKASLLTFDTHDGATLTSLMINCDAVTSMLQSHSHQLGMSQFRRPSLCVSHELRTADEMSAHKVKATASSQSLTLAVKQDPIGLMEVLDLLFRDEIAQLYRLKTQLPDLSKSESPAAKGDRPSSFKISIATFLDAYEITLPLVPSLTYQISGVVARAACAANSSKEIIFDFDIKENSHEMQMNVKNEARAISLLQIPPTNGRITMSQGQKAESMLNVLCSVEVMRLDASAIYNLLTALNRPQISTAIEEVQQQSKAIQDHIEDIFGTSEAKEAQNPSSNLVYAVHLTLAGLQVAAKTSLKSDAGSIAHVLFSMDKAYLRASNRHEIHGPILKYPEIHLNLRHVGFDIERGTEGNMRSCGNFGASFTVSASSSPGEDGEDEWSFNFRSDGFDVNLSPRSTSTAVDVLGYLGTKIKDLDTSRELDYLRKLRQSKPRISINDDEVLPEYTDILESILGSVVYRFELRNIRASWNVADESGHQASDEEDLVLSIKLIEFGTRTKRSARLAIEDFQLQTVPPGQDRSMRSPHSALLPQVIFNIAYFSTPVARRFAFQAVGESLDLRLTSAFIVPAANLVESILLSAKNVQKASVQWNTEAAQGNKRPESAAASKASSRSVFGNKRLESLLVDADFAGAVVYVSSARTVRDAGRASRNDRPSLAGKYGQFTTDDSGSGAVLRSPGLAWKAEYRDNGLDDPALSGEVKIDASSNILYPSVVPLIMDIVSSVKAVVSDGADHEPASKPEPPKPRPEKPGDEDNILTADPSAVLGRVKLNLGLRICRQEFSLSCQPIARVAATTSFEDVYFTLNTVSSQDHGNFFAISGALNKPRASVQHVYSRESTASFELDTVTLSFMNSKHVSGTSGVSAILSVSPMKISVNAKQVQDFLLFREIWYPKDLRADSTTPPPVAKLATETSQGHLVQRYQQVAATAAFPWTATISIAALDVSVDMGQAIGKSVFQINDFWVSSKKTSDWEQNLCLGFDKIGIDCTGRLSGFITLRKFRLRTSIHWPKREEALNETPLVQASIAFNELRVKAAFDYQAFLIADVTSLEFLMYNVREGSDSRGDRLVAIFDGDAVQVFGTATSAAQAVALYQTLQKLMQERRENFELSLKEIEKFMRRKSTAARPSVSAPTRVPKLPEDDTMAKSPISLDTDVVVTLRALNLGVFPNTFSDHQVFKMEALNAYARFAASIEQRRIHSMLRMTLGQLRIGLAGVRNIEAPKTLSEMSVEDVVQRSTGSRGGTILKVPRVEAAMQTWQAPNSNHIDYLFKSAFEGKVEVGWNYSRISYIRGMWAKHNKSLEETWGRQMPLTAVKITGVPEAEEGRQEGGEQQKITAEVTVPQSKYEYLALEPPIIETPQLRDMGEATPPLEWIGLHRERLPNLTHQIVIVSLLELAGEVEDAYSRILGSS